jgi:hypothetical protein
MAAHAEGADHHDRADRIPGRPEDIGVRQRDSTVAGLLFDLLFDVLLDQPPIAVEGRDQLAIRLDRPVLRLPRGALGILDDVGGVVGEVAEELAPLRIHRIRVLLVARLQLLDIGGVAAVEEGRYRETIVGLVLPLHFIFRSAAPRLLL